MGLNECGLSDKIRTIQKIRIISVKIKVKRT